jgi:hypothetical protein
MAADSVHQVSPPLQASIVSIESDSAMTELHPRRFASIRPSFMAIASSIDADDTWGANYVLIQVFLYICVRQHESIEWTPIIIQLI